MPGIHRGRADHRADDGVPARVLRDLIVGKPFFEAVRCRLEGYLRTPAGPAALRQDNDRGRDPATLSPAAADHAHSFDERDVKTESRLNH
jgi:hypothetical protein